MCFWMNLGCSNLVTSGVLWSWMNFKKKDLQRRECPIQIVWHQNYLQKLVFLALRLTYGHLDAFYMRWPLGNSHLLTKNYQVWLLKSKQHSFQKFQDFLIDSMIYFLNALKRILYKEYHGNSFESILFGVKKSSKENCLSNPYLMIIFSPEESIPLSTTLSLISNNILLEFQWE